MKIRFLIIITIIIVILAIGGVLGYYAFYHKNINDNKTPAKTSTSNSSSSGVVISSSKAQVVINQDNLPDFLKTQNIVKDLPSNAVIMLKLYNYDTGERQWESSYVIKKGSVTKGSVEEPDITLILASKYVPKLSNFCGTIQTAKKNNDFGVETTMSQTALLWKYKSVMKYKDCLM